MSDAARTDTGREHPEAGPERRTPALRRGVGLLVAGGVLSGLNGAAHFVLPGMYGWEQHTAELYEPVRWALYATTVFFAVLLVFAGVLTVLLARSSDIPVRVIGWVAGAMAAFWILAAGYELAVPFPAAGADWALPLFSVVTALLYLAGGGLRLHTARPAPPRRTAARSAASRTAVR